MKRAERRRLRERKIKQRKNLLKSLYWWYRKDSINPKIEMPEDGYFENGSFLNAEGGPSKKTNWRKGHSNYRRKGSYGKGMNYKPHDQRQIDKEINQEK